MQAGIVVCPHCGAVSDVDINATLTLPRRTHATVAPVAEPQAADAAQHALSDSPSGSMAAWRAGGKGPLALGEVFAGRFRIEKHLGSGALATAFLARSGNAPGFICLKILHPRKATDPRLVQEWIGLQQAVSRYQTRGIAQVFDAGIEGDMPWCAMEALSGPTLRMWMLERLQFESRIPPGLDMVQALIGIFERIHEMGCYGVLKPENVFMTPQGPVLTDFGIPGFLTAQEFEFNTYARRYLPYMAPELRQDFANLLPQSDYYSLGAVLYEILTGRPPGQPVKLPSALSPLFGIEADEVVLKSLATRPGDRFGSNIGFTGALSALRDSLRQQKPEAFAATTTAPSAPFSSSALADIPSARPTLTVHSPDLQGNPDQDFEPPSQFTGHLPLRPALRDKAAEAQVAAPEATLESPGIEALQGVKTPELADSLAGEKKTPGFTEVESPWAVLEAGISDEVVVGNALLAEADGNKSAGKIAAFDEEWLASKPTPYWVWLLIAFLGLALTVGAGYLGFHFGH